MFRNRNLAALAVFALSGSSLGKPVAGSSWVGETCICPPSNCPPTITSYTTITTTPIHTITITTTISHESSPSTSTTPSPSAGVPEVPSSPIVVPTPPTSTPCDTVTQTTTISGSEVIVTLTITPSQPPILSIITLSQPSVQTLTTTIGTPIISTGMSFSPFLSSFNSWRINIQCPDLFKVSSLLAKLLFILSLRQSEPPLLQPVCYLPRSRSSWLGLMMFCSMLVPGTVQTTIKPIQPPVEIFTSIVGTPIRSTGV